MIGPAATGAHRAEEVLRLADEGESRLATAESCTGGLLAALLTMCRSLAQIALAIAGWAGPRSDSEEEGLVHLPRASKNGDTCHREAHFGAIGRQGVRIAAPAGVLDMTGAALKERSAA